MFVGHFAAGFAAKRWAPRLPLSLSLAAAQLPDLVWPALLLAGVEQAEVAPGDTVVTPLRFISYPWSHSLVMTAAWGGLFGLLYLWRSADRRGAAWIALLSVSHWLLDVASHRADMPFSPGLEKRIGFELWSSLSATIAVESVLYAAGLALYLSPRREARCGRVALGFLAATLYALYLANLFGPPPPNLKAVAASGLLLGVILLAWAGWVDRRVGPVRTDADASKSIPKEAA